MYFKKDARIILYSQPVTMFKGFDSLLSIVFNELKIELVPNTYVLFVNRDRNRFKLLFFEKKHISILAMRLSGAMQFKFGEIIELNKSSFYDLITNIKSRQIKARYGLNRSCF